MIPISRDLKKSAAVFVILVLTLIAFSPSLKNGFVNWDDNTYVTNNPALRSFSAENLKEIFTSFFLANYQPLTILSYSLDYHFSGLNPLFYHWTNLFLHLLNCLLVFWLISILSGRFFVAFLTAVLFGLHPMHVESVAWISERKDVLYALFFLGAIICYCYYLRTSSLRRFYYASLGLFLLSLLSKAMAITLPVVLFLVDYLLLRKDRKMLFADKIPFFVLSFIFGGVAFFAQYATGAVRQQEFFNLLDKVLIAAFAIVFYLYKILWPVKLCSLYPYFIMPGRPMFLLCLVALFVVALAWAVFSLRKFSRKIIFSSLFFLVTILPVLQLVPLGQAIVADRYIYIPCIGILYGVSEGIFWLYAKKVKYGNKAGRILLSMILISLILAAGALTWKRCGVWKDDSTLWRDVLDRYPHSSTACNNLGVVFAQQGKTKQAAALFKKAIKIDPHYSSAYNNLGIIYDTVGRSEEAIVLFKKAIEIQPRFAQAYNNLAKAYVHIGRGNEASMAYDRAIEISPDYVEAYVHLGVLYARTGRNDQAIKLFKRAIEIDPAYAEAYGDLGVVYASQGRRKEAIALFKKALKIDPAYAAAYGNLSLAYAEEKQGGLAVEYYDKAKALGYRSAVIEEKLKTVTH